MASKPSTIEELCAWVEQIISGSASDANPQKGAFIQGSLGKPVPGASEKRITFRPVTVKDGDRIQVVFSEARRDLTKILHPQDLPHLIREKMPNQFLCLSVKTTERDLHAEVSRSGKLQVGFSKPTQTTAPDRGHNRIKHYALSPSLRWMQELGISNDRAEIRHEMRDKFIQIERFVNILRPELEPLIAKHAEISALDIGSGKSYLTFALYELLRSLSTSGDSNQPPHIAVHGIERRSDLVSLCSRIARNTKLEGLSFLESLAEHGKFPTRTNANNTAKIIVALHACDTATDDAIALGIKEQADLICVAPCCQKYVRKKMNPKGTLSALSQHGIVEERLAEMITDSLRGLFLETHGYRTKIVEFIDKSHTAKNTMILAARAGLSESEQTTARERMELLRSDAGLKDFYLDLER